MSRKKLEHLFAALQIFKDNTHGDLSIHEPSNDDDLHHICIAQKIIHCEDDVFDISCLYDSHPTLCFPNVVEVVEFFNGFFDYSRVHRDFHNLNSLDIAYNIGVYCDLEYLMKNALVCCVNKRLHKIQYNWNDTK